MAKKIKVVVINPERLDWASEVWTKALYDSYVRHEAAKELKEQEHKEVNN